MGFLDFLFDKEKGAERTLIKLEKKLTNMYVQAPERQYAVQELREVGTSDAVWVLLQRYNENNPNTTVDIEEKELVFSTLVGMSRDAEADVVGQIKRYVTEKEVKINWPMKALHAILPEDKYVEFIVETLQTCRHHLPAHHREEAGADAAIHGRLLCCAGPRAEPISVGHRRDHPILGF